MGTPKVFGRAKVCVMSERCRGRKSSSMTRPSVASSSFGRWLQVFYCQALLLAEELI